MARTAQKPIVCADKKYNTRQRVAKICLDNQNSPLLRLPAELRYKIYGYVFGVSCIRACSLRSDVTWCERCFPAIIPNDTLQLHYPHELLTFTETCRQIYAESKLLPFAVNEICGRAGTINDAIHRYLSREQADAIAAIFVLSTYYSVFRKHVRSDWVRDRDMSCMDELPNLRTLTIQLENLILLEEQVEQFRSMWMARVTKIVNRKKQDVDVKVKFVFAGECG